MAISSWDRVLSMNDKEKEKAFQARLKTEQEEREYTAWKKKNDPQEQKKIELFNPSKNSSSFAAYFFMVAIFQIWFWFIR
jgi:hypothetical protein